MYILVIFCLFYCRLVYLVACYYIDVISPNEVFGDIMVLSSPRPPPVDPDDVNTLTQNKYSTYLFQILYVGRYLRYFDIEI